MMNDKIKAELAKASEELQESTGALAILTNEFEKARAKAQVRVTMAAGKVSALVAIINS